MTENPHNVYDLWAKVRRWTIHILMPFLNRSSNDPLMAADQEVIRISGHLNRGHQRPDLVVGTLNRRLGRFGHFRPQLTNVCYRRRCLLGG